MQLYLKDESTHPTGSLKHRLARSLFLYALCNGWVGQGSTVVEASSGSTAISEAYFAQLLGLPFVAVMPATTSPSKIVLIEARGGTCHLVADPGTIYAESRRLAGECGGHFMDQFTHAERATDWRGNNNIAESIFTQLAFEEHPVPTWVVVGAGTGGTSATIGRYVRYRRLATRLCVVDPEGSVFFDAWRTNDPDLAGTQGLTNRGDRPSPGRALVRRAGHRPDGAGPRLRLGGHCAARQPDAGPAGRWVHRHQPVGAFGLIAGMLERGERGSVVTLLCDGGERYGSTYFDDDWVCREGLDLGPATAQLAEFARSGAWTG